MPSLPKREARKLKAKKAGKKQGESAQDYTVPLVSMRANAEGSKLRAAGVSGKLLDANVLEEPGTSSLAIEDLAIEVSRSPSKAVEEPGSPSGAYQPRCPFALGHSATSSPTVDTLSINPEVPASEHDEEPMLHQPLSSSFFMVDSDPAQLMKEVAAAVSACRVEYGEAAAIVESKMAAVSAGTSTGSEGASVLEDFVRAARKACEAQNRTIALQNDMCDILDQQIHELHRTMDSVDACLAEQNQEVLELQQEWNMFYEDLAAHMPHLLHGLSRFPSTSTVHLSGWESQGKPAEAAAPSGSAEKALQDRGD